MSALMAPPELEATERRYPALISPRRALAIIELMRLPPGGAALDVACGRGGLLVDAVAMYGCSGLGLGEDPALLAQARADAAANGVAGRTEFRACTPLEFVAERRYDAILCVGAAAAFGAPAEAAARCLEWLRVGGVLLVGDPFLRRAPPPGYRALLGTAVEQLPMTGGHAHTIVAAGYELLATAVCSESEWDAHESAAYRACLQSAAARPGDPQARELRARAELRYHAYWKYGRDTLGYAFHAFRKPRAPLRAVGAAPVAAAPGAAAP